MEVVNIHTRTYRAEAQALGTLLDSLTSEADVLWPREHWPPLRFDGPLAIGARGGHGPIRYWVCAYEPGRRIRCTFSAPAGFCGYHEYRAEAVGAGSRLVHELRMRTAGAAVVTWPLVFGPLHDALIEDSLSKAEEALGEPVTARRWSRRVRLLRHGLGLLRGMTRWLTGPPN